MFRRHPRTGQRSASILCAITLSSASLFAQAADDVAMLRKEIQDLKTGQVQLQKDLQIIKDIIVGKRSSFENVIVSTVGSATLGQPTAPVTMIEFSDYQCPYCAGYAIDTLPHIIGDYVSTGKVRYVLRNFPLEDAHPLALKAAAAAACAGEQGKYWEAHDRFFKTRALTPEDLIGHAKTLNLDRQRFQQCLASSRIATKIQADKSAGEQLGVTGTPSFFFGYTDANEPMNIEAVDFIAGAQPFAVFKELIDGLLVKRKEPGSGVAKSP
jgi:protein-disulfide isomerase